MRIDLDFSKWLLEYADYGFEKQNTKKANYPTFQSNSDDSGPWKNFDIELFFKELKNLSESDNKKTKKVWHEEMSWLENGNMVEVNINPFGSLRITTRKYIKDLQGSDVRICKNVFDIDDHHTDQEISIAHKIYEHVKEFSKVNIDYPTTDIFDLKKLAHKLFNATKQTYPDYIMFPISLKEMNDSYYKLIFEFRGAGAGAPNSSVGMQFDINLAFDKQKGLIRCWGCNVDSPSPKRQFNIQPSEWDEYFSPQEENKKIIGMIITTLMTY
jgi:hypothetical protein